VAANEPEGDDPLAAAAPAVAGAAGEAWAIKGAGGTGLAVEAAGEAALGAAAAAGFGGAVKLDAVSALGGGTGGAAKENEALVLRGAGTVNPASTERRALSSAGRNGISRAGGRAGSDRSSGAARAAGTGAGAVFESNNSMLRIGVRVSWAVVAHDARSTAAPAARKATDLIFIGSPPRKTERCSSVEYIPRARPRKAAACSDR